MRQRLLTLTQKYSLFLFGARGTGKSTLVESTYNLEKSLYINLLDPTEEDEFSRNPKKLIDLVEAMPAEHRHVIIDEIQKIPKLLDVVHLLIESKKCKKYFILTGSSARKLKAKGVNLLAGRAFVYHLYPFSFLEVADQFTLEAALMHGMLPKTFEFDSEQDKKQFLQAYTLTYLKEEVWGEQLVKNLDPFRRFLEVAAQANGKIINYSNIARDTGVDDKTVKNYFSILEDTLLAFILEPFTNSFRKRLGKAPKFYFFDVGIARSLARMLNTTPKSGTSYYGELFESFIITESMKLATYHQKEYKFSYLMTSTGAEVDLVVERPAEKTLLIEIKSATHVDKTDINKLAKIASDIDNCEAVFFTNETRPRKVGDIMIYPWQEGIQQYFLADK